MDLYGVCLRTEATLIIPTGYNELALILLIWISARPFARDPSAAVSLVPSQIIIVRDTAAHSSSLNYNNNNSATILAGQLAFFYLSVFLLSPTLLQD